MFYNRNAECYGGLGQRSWTALVVALALLSEESSGTSDPKLSIGDIYRLHAGTLIWTQFRYSSETLTSVWSRLHLVWCLIRDLSEEVLAFKNFDAHVFAELQVLLLLYWHGSERSPRIIGEA